MNLNDIQQLVFEEYKKNGYLAMWEGAIGVLKAFGDPNTGGLIDLAELGLIGTEITEAMEDVRSNEPDLQDKLGIELADIIIRVLNFASRKGIDITSYIIKKHKKNLERGKLHGRNI